MYTSKGYTIYLDGIEIAYLRTYLGTDADKRGFAEKVAAGLNQDDIAAQMAKALTDLVGLIKAPDKNMRYYASQVKSALFDAERCLHEYKGMIDVEQDRKDLDKVTLGDDAPLDADDVGLGAMAFDSSLSEVGLAATLTAPPIFLDDFAEPTKSEIIRDVALVMGQEVREIPISKPSDWDTVIVLPNISRVQRDAILAGLRLLQQQLTGVDKWAPKDIIDEIAGDSGRVITPDDIDGLCEAFNIG